jgi:uncharacterized protein
VKYLILAALLMTTQTFADYKADIETWRGDQEKRLRSETSWLSVVGLAWLKDGKNTIGSAPDNQVKLPSSAPANLGTLEFSNGKVELKFSAVEGVTVNGEKADPKKSYPLTADVDGKATEIKTGTVTFFLIKRKNGQGIRIKDAAATARESFKGRQWYKVDPNLKIEATWKPFDKPEKIIVPDILGNENEELSPGVAEFKIKGKVYKLTPTAEDNELFFVFKDATSGKQSYGAARFLYADAPKDGKVILDFNRTVNPPCAFTDFATCPLPPKSNILTAAIHAGEKAPLEKHH